MESEVGGKENIKSRLRIQPTRRVKQTDSNNDDKENIPIQHQKTTDRKKVVTRKSKKGCKSEPVVDQKTSERKALVTRKSKKGCKSEPVVDRTLKSPKSKKIKKEKITKRECDLENYIDVIFICYGCFLLTLLDSDDIVSRASPANTNENVKRQIDSQGMPPQVSKDYQQPKSVILKPGEKRKRNQDKITFEPFRTRSFSIVLDRNDIAQYRSSQQPKINKSIGLSVQSHNSLAADKNISLISDNQPAVVENRRARNKIVPFKKTKEASEYGVGELVLAHVTGFCDWPAFIRSTHGQIISVEFFGTGQM